MKNNFIKVTTKMKGEQIMIERNVKKEQEQLHSLLPLTLPSTNNPVDCLYERKGGRRPDEGADAVRSNTLETAKGGQQSLHSLLPLGEGGRRPDEGLKRRAKDAQSQCPPLETLPNKNNPVDCFCERKPKSLISRRGSERSELLTPHQVSTKLAKRSLSPTILSRKGRGIFYRQCANSFIALFY